MSIEVKTMYGIEEINFDKINLNEFGSSGDDTMSGGEGDELKLQFEDSEEMNADALDSLFNIYMV